MLTNIFRKTVAVSLFCAAFAVSAEEYSLSNVKDWHRGSNLVQHTPGVLRGKGRISAISSKIFPYTPGKTYVLRGLIHQLAGSDSNIFRVGIQPLDEKGKSLDYSAGHPEPNTDTVLTKPVRPEDKCIFVKDTSRWNKGRSIALGTSPDQSDLPNKNIIHQNPTAFTKTADGWKISFAKPVGFSFAAGTGVRLHRRGGWNRYVGIGTGGQVLFDLKCNDWDIGTKGFRVTVISGTGKAQPGERVPVLEIRNLRLEVK